MGDNVVHCAAHELGVAVGVVLQGWVQDWSFGCSLDTVASPAFSVQVDVVAFV